MTEGKTRWAEYTESAWALANTAHAGQLDKNGRPYITHPMRVASRMPPGNLGAQIVALLHDAVEDNEGVTTELLSQIFPQRIVKALDAISRRPGEPYGKYLERCKADSLARTVKLADLRDNLDERRRYEGETSLRRRYIQSIKKLRAL